MTVVDEHQAFTSTRGLPGIGYTCKQNRPVEAIERSARAEYRQVHTLRFTVTLLGHTGGVLGLALSTGPLVGDLPGDPGCGGGAEAHVVALEERWAVAAGVVNAAAGTLVELMADAIERDVWQGHRIHSPVQWAMWKAGIDRQAARRIVLVATRARELPITVGLLREGRLSLDQAAAVARYTPAVYEGSVCELAVNASVAQIVAATRFYAFDVESPPERQPRPRGVSFGTDADGSWWARVCLAADEGAIVEQALAATRDRLHDDERAAARQRAETEGRSGEGTDSELGVRPVGWADAMACMAYTVLANGADGAGLSSPAKAIVHLELPEPGVADDRWLAELHGGSPLPAWLRRQLTCGSDVEVVGERSGVPVTAWRTRRTPPPTLRRLIEYRDRYMCRVPGCGRSRWLQVHHVIHWEDRPDSTVTPNLVCLCSKHHRLHHQGHLGIRGNADAARGDPDELVFTDPYTNRRLEPVGQPRAPSPADFPQVDPYNGPTGEQLQPDLIWFDPTRPVTDPEPGPAG